MHKQSESLTSSQTEGALARSGVWCRCTVLAQSEIGRCRRRPLPESRAYFGHLALLLLLQHLWTLLTSVGRLLDNEALPGLLLLHSVAG